MQPSKDATKPTIAVIQGDPAGIGPELLVKLLSDETVRARANILVIGDPSIFARGQTVVDTSVTMRHIDEARAMDFSQGAINHLDLLITGVEEVPVSIATALGGRASIKSYEMSLDLSRQGLVDGICFMPFNKQSMHLGGNRYTDELGFAVQFFGLSVEPSEFNVAHGMWNGRVTSHVPMREVPNLLTIDRVHAAIMLAHRTLLFAGFVTPRIVVAAYNPHAGDGGVLGMEEIEVIGPAVAAAVKQGVAATGPLPSDTLWLKVRAGEYDCAVTMYHDQGQIAIKLLGFDQGVSVLAGLPVPITTPAHGTAFDIAGKNLANVIPSRNAFMMVAEMAEKVRGS